MEIPGVGDEWRHSSLVWGAPTGIGVVVEVRSPVNQSVLQAISPLDSEELARLFAPHEALPAWNVSEINAFCLRLHDALDRLREPLIEAMQWETAFIRSDCVEMVDGALTFVKEYGLSYAGNDADMRAPAIYSYGTQTRSINLATAPWGTVAVILPQNAFLYLAVICMLNALAAGNRVILRAPLQSARSAGLLAAAVRMADLPTEAISIVQVGAREFTAALYEYSQPCLLHYMGSSRHASAILSEAFVHSKGCIIDGEGNGWSWVDHDVACEEAVSMLTESAIRYNGQTCTSINGALIHPDLFPQMRERLIARWQQLRSGDPFTAGVQVGPLLNEAQAQWCRSRVEASGAKLLCGGDRNANLLCPSLLENPSPDSELLREGIFGPVLWIAPGTRDQFVKLWQRNRYPLSAGIVSQHPDRFWWATRLSNLARLVFNGDPSLEYIHAPWGGYPSGGMNPVSHWIDKYRRVIQIDAPSL